MNKELIKDFPLKKIIPYARNPRINKGAVDALAKSIKRVGNNDPIEVNEQYVILCGHTRKLALEKLGITKTDIIRITGLTDEQQREYRITNNKIGEIAEWDFEILENDFSSDELIEFGFDTRHESANIKNENTNPYRKVHYLISVDVADHQKISKIIKDLEQIEGVEIEQGQN